jgi:dTDP-glucose pyrophosphorylase
MNNKPSLVVLAAGMGSRYGGLKQMDAFGPNGETIIDYSIYDAIKAGFGKVVFIIREHFKEEFQTFFANKFQDQIEVEYVTQELYKLPASFTVPEGREKPWGTAHAVLMAKDVVDGPFAVINADDYYGPEAYQVLADFFAANVLLEEEEFAVVAYKLQNTLSDHGTVNRGVCYGTGDGYLTEVIERIKIGKNEKGDISYPNEDGSSSQLGPETLVSMNLWGFMPSYFELSEKIFKDFLKSRGEEMKSEFFIPLAIDAMINKGSKKIRILHSDAHWFGVTYQEDKPIVITKLEKLIEEDVYPKKLW